MKCKKTLNKRGFIKGIELKIKNYDEYLPMIIKINLKIKSKMKAPIKLTRKLNKNQLNKLLINKIF